MDRGTGGAPRPRPDTRRGTRRGPGGRRPGRPATRRAALPRRRPASGGRRAGAVSARARGTPSVAGMTTTLTRPNTPPARSAELLLAHAHLRLGSLALARTAL